MNKKKIAVLDKSIEKILAAKSITIPASDTPKLFAYIRALHLEDIALEEAVDSILKKYFIVRQGMLKDLKKKPKRQLFTLKVSKEELETFREKAQIYAGGNISAWIRYAALKYAPVDKEIA